MSRKTVILCLLSLIILVSLTTSVLAEVKGPIVDKIYVGVRMKEEIGLMDAAEGLTDVFFWGVSGPTIMGLDQATRDKLDIYSVPSGSRSLNFNPIPNVAPYIVKVEEKEYFNPFAIREVRFAMNDLINRQYIVDEILGGAGGPQFVMATPGQPGTYKYGLIATRMGMTAEGNEKKALDEIAEALQGAAALPELQGRLVKQGEWWTFDGEPATIKFLIRVDCVDRSKYGQYIANQIEKAGIKVERLLWDRSKCGTIVYNSDPADYKWNIYTEGWGAGATRAFWEHIVCQMYAPWYGYMAGGPDHEWQYTNEEIDEVTEKAYTGNFLTEEEYWEYALKGLELGLKDACRIYLTYQNDYFAANKEAFNKRMAYGLGDGLNEWSLITADTKSKELRMTQFSAKGALFMSAWDPIGTKGFDDVYSLNLAYPMIDRGMFEHPASAIPTAWRVVPEEVETEVSRDKETGDVVGDILVSPDAIKYDSAKKEWYKVGADVKAMSTGIYSFRWGNFHHGLPITTTNILYAGAFKEEWINEDGEGDKYYNAAYERTFGPELKTDKGMVLNPDGTITTYFDYNFPPSKERTASWGAPWISVGDRNIIQPWEIYEALAELVAVGSESGTVYSFTPAEGVEQVDLLRPSCVKDIRAKLAEMLDKGHVPVSIKDYVTVEEAKAGYETAIQWIDEKGQAFISNGPFYLEKYDPATSFMELSAFRDPEYPFTPDYWPGVFITTTVRIDSVDIPSLYLRLSKKEGIPVKVQVSEVLYPEGAAKLAEKGEVSVVLITPTEEISAKARYVEAGLFEAVIPAEAIKDLEAGSYTILINASIVGAVPASLAGSTVVY